MSRITAWLLGAVMGLSGCLIWINTLEIKTGMYQLAGYSAYLGCVAAAKKTNANSDMCVGIAKEHGLEIKKLMGE